MNKIKVMNKVDFHLKKFYYRLHDINYTMTNYVIIVIIKYLNKIGFLKIVIQQFKNTYTLKTLKLPVHWEVVQENIKLVFSII